MTEQEYRTHPAISRSQLWLMHESPEKFRYAMDNPDEPTPALLFGQMVHMMVLQTWDEWHQAYAVAPKADKRTKEGKEIWASFQAECADRTAVSFDDFQTAKDMTDAVYNNEFASKLLAGSHEVPFFWTDEMTGIECKCRCDCLTYIGDQLYIVDYKSSADASVEQFQRDAFRYGYALQAAMYSEGVKANMDGVPKFVFIVQEKKAPYSVNIFETDDAVITYGHDQFRQYIGMYKDCMTSGNWYGYLGRENVINTLMLPAYLSAKE